MILCGNALAQDESDALRARALAAAPQDAVALNIELIKSFPESRHLPDAYTDVGDYYFDTNNAYKALMAYQRASAWSTAPRYPYVVYRLALCYRNVSEYTKATELLKQVLAVTDATTTPSQEEVYGSLAELYADAGDVPGAQAAFHGRPDLLIRTLERLANTRKETGKADEARALYHLMLQIDPGHPQAAAWRSAAQ